jgi:LysM repeat protein
VARKLNHTTSSRKDAISAKSMNSPNPFVPQGSLLEQQSQRRSRLKFAVFCILAVGITGLTAMLIQGCKREQTETENQQPPEMTNEMTANTNPPPVEASNPPVAPPPVVTTPAPAPPAESEYVVVKGDSFWKIAKKNGVTVKALEAANPGVDAAKLKVGQKLVIPAASSAGSAESATDMTGSASAPGGEQIYIVKSGDTLAKIARRNGTTVKAIESENGLSTTRIKVGEKLKIPAKAESAPPAAAPAPAPASNSAPADTGAPPAPTDNTQQ